MSIPETHRLPMPLRIEHIREEFRFSAEVSSPAEVQAFLRAVWQAEEALVAIRFEEP